jgi:glycosyltransferase involved in cell wall biosynthesis
VYFLGNKPVDQLPSYNQYFDVSILCYKIDDYTKYIYPLKLHEYLATGLPVVGSPIRTLQEFDGTIRLASTADEWSAAISASLAPESFTPSAIEARRKVAREHDWDRIVHLIAQTICERLGPPYPSRFRERTVNWIYPDMGSD